MTAFAFTPHTATTPRYDAAGELIGVTFCTCAPEELASSDVAALVTGSGTHKTAHVVAVTFPVGSTSDALADLALNRSLRDAAELWARPAAPNLAA